MSVLVIDASTLVAAVADAGPDGRWAEPLLLEDALAAPQLVTAEAGNILRRLELAGTLSAGDAALAHRDLLDCDLELFPYAPLASRIWELRGALTVYDAWYVALAEALDAPLATLDPKLTRAAGPRCRFLTPE
ncbi:MAG TPA: type II toxin-antitoxin system VapC family toxin [Vicinamibacteria bacterium]|nr:type II toxin-antitoxin system VapC family toxin [Vicinamibacteria bacterium]